jgi:GxxExxY protein
MAGITNTLIYANNTNDKRWYMADLIYPELSYTIIGILYKVYNKIGGGYQEKLYQKAIKGELFAQQVPFLEQVRTDLNYNGRMIGRYYLDFIIDHKVVLELKTTPSFAVKDIMQVLNYLKQSNLKLGILASLNRNNIMFKRILKGRN